MTFGGAPGWVLTRNFAGVDGGGLPGGAGVGRQLNNLKNTQGNINYFPACGILFETIRTG